MVELFLFHVCIVIRRTRNHIDVTKTGTFLEGEIRYRGRMGGVEQTSHRGDSIKISV